MLKELNKYITEPEKELKLKIVKILIIYQYKFTRVNKK